MKEYCIKFQVIGYIEIQAETEEDAKLKFKERYENSFDIVRYINAPTVIGVIEPPLF